MSVRTDRFCAFHSHIDDFGIWLPRVPHGQHPLCRQTAIKFADGDLFYDFLAPRCIECHDTRERSSLPYEFATTTRIEDTTAHLDLVSCTSTDSRAVSIAMRTRHGWLIAFSLNDMIQFVLFMNSVGAQTLWAYNDHWKGTHIKQLLDSCGHDAQGLL